MITPALHRCCPPTVLQSPLPLSQHLPQYIRLSTRGAHALPLTERSVSRGTTPLSGPPTRQAQRGGAPVDQGGEQDVVELARAEAEVMEKIAALRRRGLWSVRRMARCAGACAAQGALGLCAGGDVLAQCRLCAGGRKWKRAGTRKLARTVTRPLC